MGKRSLLLLDYFVQKLDLSKLGTWKECRAGDGL